MISTDKNMDEFEDMIFNFRAYPIQSESDLKAALADYSLSKDLTNIIIEMKSAILENIIDAQQQQMTQFSFDFLIQSLTKNNISLFTNIITYTATNQTAIV
ncbi:MAG: hypothetical protein ACK4YV_02770 [Emticicia sp.]